VQLATLISEKHACTLICAAESGGKQLLTYKAMYKILDNGVHAEVIDFPGAITCGAGLDEARRLLASALVDMAETNLLAGEPLPAPDPTCTDPDADLEEPIHLILTPASRVTVMPQDVVA
jgi:predicted RNase H-like HicB family nuclease